MPNIVYVLTNPAMPGFVKIGITDRPDVQDRMADLYTTGVPFPFDCVIAWEIEGKAAVEIERALHTAFAPNRPNRSREFFQLESEQVEVLLRVMPGRDVTPQVVDKLTDLQMDDRDASSAFTKRRSRTTEEEFLDSLSANGRIVYERVLALGKRDDMWVNWTMKGFSLNVVSKGSRIALCYGYPPSSFNQKIYTGFDWILDRSNVPEEVVEQLKAEALKTGLFVPAGRGVNLTCETDRSWDENQLTTLTDWLSTLVKRIREFET